MNWARLTLISHSFIIEPMNLAGLFYSDIMELPLTGFSLCSNVPSFILLLSWLLGHPSLLESLCMLLRCWDVWDECCWIRDGSERPRKNYVPFNFLDFLLRWSKMIFRLVPFCQWFIGSFCRFIFIVMWFLIILFLFFYSMHITCSNST